MKPGMILISTSRGSISDTAALLRALSDGTVTAAALDVIEEEPTVREEAELIRSVFPQTRPGHLAQRAHPAANAKRA